jgi:hypothetical protein
MAYTLAKSENEVLACWDFLRNHAVHDRSSNGGVHEHEKILSLA